MTSRPSPPEPLAHANALEALARLKPPARASPEEKIALFEAKVAELAEATQGGLMRAAARSPAYLSGCASRQPALAVALLRSGLNLEPMAPSERAAFLGSLRVADDFCDYGLELFSRARRAGWDVDEAAREGSEHPATRALLNWAFHPAGPDQSWKIFTWCVEASRVYAPERVREDIQSQIGAISHSSLEPDIQTATGWVRSLIESRDLEAAAAQGKAAPPAPRL